MAKYKEIKGVTVQTRDEDPVLNVGTWSSDANMNTARISSTGTGSSSEGYIIAGGYYLPPSVDRSVTESYNGTAWTEVADCPQDLTYGNGLGSYTSSLLCSYSQPGPAPGGYGPTTATHQWNGSSWSTKNSMNTFRQNAGTGGTTTAGIVFGGSGPPANANTETWDGTNWTEVGDLNTAKTDIGGGVGTSTAALSASGNPATTEQWDGSSWTEVSDLNTSRQNSGKIGLYTSALCASGQNPSTYLANVESWDGTSWTEVADVSSARGYIGGATISGGNTTGIVAGGAGPGSPGLLSSTELWAFPPPTAAILTEGSLFLSKGTTLKGFGKAAGIPTGSWSSGSDINTTRRSLMGAGVYPSALIFGGYTTTTVGNTESWNGSAWTEVNDLNTVKSNAIGTGASNTSALCAMTSTTEQWDGSSWTESGGHLNTSRTEMGSCGTQTAALGIGGGSSVANVESWDGTSFTEIADLNTGRNANQGVGTQTAALTMFKGDPSPKAIVESWNGTSWTEVGDLNNGRYFGGASGFQSSALAFGGYPSGLTADTEVWNGSSWTEIGNLGTATGLGGPAHSAPAFLTLYAGGAAPGNVAKTEEWTADTTLSTVTVS